MANANTPDEMVSASVETLETEVQRIRQAIMDKVASGESFDAEATALAEASNKLAKAQLEANAGKITAGKSQLAQVIGATIESLGLADLLGEPITSVNYSVKQDSRTDEDGNEVRSDVIVIALNGKAKAAGTGKKRIRRPLKSTFDANATDDEKAAMANADDDKRKELLETVWARVNG